MANGTPEDFSNVRGFPKEITKTWVRGTTDMVNPDGSVADIMRKMVNNPDRSRAEWKATRDDSRKVAAQQHASEMEWLRENAANVAEAKTATFSKIYKNEKLRDASMREFLVDPTTYDSPPTAPGFGDQSAPDVGAVTKSDDKAPAKESAIQLADNDSGIETMANGTPEDFSNVRGFPKEITKTWARGTTDMVDSDAGVADINRKMVNNPDAARESWA